MAFEGASVYNQEDFLKSYLKRRERHDSPNNAIEGPIIHEMIGDVCNQNILDLGCGEGSFCQEVIEQGALYTGVEGSMQMAELAREKVCRLKGTIHHGHMESYPFPDSEFDLITSRFALHYVADVDGLFQRIHRSLKTEGRFVFSVQHPLTTSSFISKESGDRRGSWVVDDYFIEGERSEPWMDQVVVKYHRSIERYYRGLIKAGFTVLDLREGTPQREHFSNEDEFKRRQRIPVVLAFSCTK